MDWKATQMWRGCSRKKRYEHYGNARSYGHKYGQRVYHCKLCVGYHLASK